MVPVGRWADVDRYMMVRNPFTRYMSQYEYLRAPHNYSKFGAREIQGRDWPGYDKGRPMVGKWYKREPMTFEQFLFFIDSSRFAYGDRRWTKRRGDPSTDPRAWRSPWIWLVPLDVQMGHLAAAPGKGRLEVNVLRLENLWSDLTLLKSAYGLYTLDLRPSIRANKTLTYGEATPEDYWGFACREIEYDGTWTYVEGRAGECGECAACRIGVWREAEALGYLNVG